MDSSVKNVLNKHVIITGDLLSKSNTPIILMDTIGTVGTATKELKELSLDINTNIIYLESLKVPEQYSIPHKNYIESIKKYKSQLDAKFTFVDTNAAEISTYNTFIRKGSFYALNEMDSITREFDKLSIGIKTSVDDMKQRATSFQQLLK